MNSKKDKPEEFSVFVKNLTPDTSDQEVKDLFNTRGNNVSDVWRPLSQDQEALTRYCFVRYRTTW